MSRNTQNKRKVFNDPVYGFVTIPDELVFDIIEHPWFQRLRRIKQLGLTHLVYPGALHTRFHHALGTLYLTKAAIDTLRIKGHEITRDEELGVSLAILLHDIGHGPFSHALEHSIVSGLSHEDVSVMFMNRLNGEFGGKLSLAIEIFNNRYHKQFLHQLVSGQLDMDRMDYLKRDSFFTGVSEGVISADRLINMLNVKDDELCIEAKGIYSVEKFIVARRLMYWQVYYHKTVVAAEQILVHILKRAAELHRAGDKLFCTPAFGFFLDQNRGLADFQQHPEVLELFALLDDYDIFTAIKIWMDHPDPLLSRLSSSLVNRNLFRIEMQKEAFEGDYIERIRREIQQHTGVPEGLLHYLLYTGEITNDAYNPNHDRIKILMKDGKVEDITESSEQLNVAVLAQTVSKHYLCYPKFIHHQ